MNLNQKISNWISEMGVLLEKNDCGEYYFATYKDKTILINLTDFDLNKTAYRLNSSKRQSMSILNKFNIPHVEALNLSHDSILAYDSVINYFNEHKSMVLRGDKGTCGNNTFIIKSEDEIRPALESIIDSKTRPFISPYYYSEKEYRAMFLNGKVEFVITKVLNKETGKHNISSGASAYIEKNVKLIKDIETISKQVANIFGISFAAIDIMDTAQGLKVVEFGIPNVKRFSTMTEEHNLICKKLFQKAFLLRYNEILNL